jgi:ABC-type glycerol-3-phosphate transport system substrate-binding protein
MPVKTRNLLIALMLPVAIAVAGCGGASDEKGEAAASGGSGDKGTLSLVAYSTPQVVYDELIPAFGKTSEGEGVAFKTSSARPGTRLEPSRPARRPTS